MSCSITSNILQKDMSIIISVIERWVRTLLHRDVCKVRRVILINNKKNVNCSNPSFRKWRISRKTKLAYFWLWEMEQTILLHNMVFKDCNSISCDMSGRNSPTTEAGATCMPKIEEKINVLLLKTLPMINDVVPRQTVILEHSFFNKPHQPLQSSLTFVLLRFCPCSVCIAFEFYLTWFMANKNAFNFKIGN